LKTNFAILFLTLAISLLLLGQTVIAQENPKIVKIAGKAEILRNGQWFKAKAGSELLAGQSIRLVKGNEITLISEGGKIEIVISNGSAIKFNGVVPEKSVPWAPMIVKSKSSSSKSPLTPEIELLEGQTSVTVTGGQPVRVVTPLIIAAVRGTKFSVFVEQDGSSKVIVRDGSVMAIGRNGKNEIVEAGSTYQLTAEQFVDFLKRNKVKIPPEGWRNVPNHQLQALDARTFKSGIPDRTVQKARTRNRNNNNDNNTKRKRVS
jgi:organic radical activating enzyme